MSTVGTYAYSLAIASLLTRRASGASLAHAVAIVLGIQAGAAALTGLLIAGPVADRFNRRRTMIASDVVRFIAVATLLMGTPSTVHIAVVTAVLGCFGALFGPCLTASLPNVVESARSFRPTRSSAAPWTQGRGPHWMLPPVQPWVVSRHCETFGRARERRRLLSG